jgi:hypothetical protein
MKHVLVEHGTVVNAWEPFAQPNFLALVCLPHFENVFYFGLWRRTRP